MAAHALRARVYIAAVAAAGGAALLLSLRELVLGGIGPRLFAWVVLAALTILLGRLTVRLPLATSCRLSFSDAFIVFALLACGVGPATLVGGLEGFFATPGGRGNGTKRLFNTTGVALAVNLSARLFERMVRQAGLGGVASSPVRFSMAIVVLAAAQYFINTALVAGVIAVTEGVPLTTIWQNSYSWAGTGCLAGAAAALLIFGVNPQPGIHAALAILPFPVTLCLACRALAQRQRDARAPS